ncbi:MAG: sulfite exporter TauE/SafE family protein, partial [Spirochaetales bacterium]|nr:sulfite exporter TauE/SafE family protein [Spirochaetales bacterium]
VQIYALGTGRVFSGALSMFLFSLGTVPLMLGFGSISSILPSRFHGRILKVSALLVLLLGGGMILRGMSLNGLSFMGISSFNGLSENVRIAEINGDKQYVRTIMHSSEYEPFIVQAGLPVVWTIYAEEEDLNGCNNPLTVPEYDIRFQMKPGENIIEFTPPASPATIIYTCWMGMITSGIKVVEDLNNIDASLISDTAALAEDSEGGCGECCSDDGSTGFGDDDYLALPFPKISTENIGMPTMEEGVQILEVKIDKNGFDPAVLIMEKGMDTTWLLNVVELNELNYRLRFPAYNNQGIELIEGVNKLQFVPEFDFAYYSWKKDFGGFVKIVDDISSVNLDEIRTLVDSYNDKNNN